MAWSTRELAERGGATVNAIRHYHRLGLLDEPARRYNGYKQYGPEHLARLLLIRQLVELGVPLSQVDAVCTGRAGLPDALRELDEQHARSIERIRRARAGIAAILSERAPADVPAGFESVASHLSEADRSVIHVYARLFGDEAVADLRQMVEVDAETGAVGDEISRLPADADEATRQRLAERLAPALVRHLADHPWRTDPRARLSRNRRVVRGTFVEAVTALYNPAQLDVFARVGVLAQRPPACARRLAA